MKLIIVRHGETEANKQRICQGQTHGTLNEKGLEQAICAGERLRRENIDACYCSDLNRALQTAQEITKFHDSLDIIPDIRLRERYFGSFQGQKFPLSLADFTPPEETETLDEIIVRLNSLLQEIQVKHREETVLLVSHGFAIKVLFSIIFHIETADLETLNDIKNASVSILELNKLKYSVIELNETSHLKETSY